MKKMDFNTLIFVCMIFLGSCEKEELSFTTGDIEIEISTGENWLHDFPMFLGISKKNAPQFAIWIEDTSGNYLSTVFVTYKIATESWVANKGNRRVESLPHWCHQRGIIYQDGLMLPTNENPITDGLTGATPKEDKTIQLNPHHLPNTFVVKAEFNHSVDFNKYYPKNAKEEDPNYSGGEQGSGQPAVVYSISVLHDAKEMELDLIGHSSPDGSDGRINNDLDKLSSAMSIVQGIKLIVK